MFNLTNNLPLPSSITIDTVETGGHAGDTAVLKKLVIEDSIAGNITIQESGHVIVNGVIEGDVKNYGTLMIEKSGEIIGSLHQYGKLILEGSLSHGALYLKTGSHSYIDSIKMNQIKTIASEPSAFVEMKSGGGFNVYE